MTTPFLIPRRSLATAATITAVLLLGAGRSVEASETSPGSAAEADEVVNGRRLFTRNCAPCHGRGARGDGPLAGSFDPPPEDLVAAGVRVSIKGLHVVFSMPHYSSRLLRERAREGNGSMPAWKDTLTPEEIDAIVLYVRSLMDEQGSE